MHESSIKFFKSTDTLWNSVEIYGHSVEAVFETQKPLHGIPWGNSMGYEEGPIYKERGLPLS